MEGKNGKIIALIVGIIVIVLAILIIPIVREALIFKTIDSKTAKLEETEKNVYMKIENGEEVAEVYFLNDAQKIVLNGKILGDVLRVTQNEPEPAFSVRFKTEFYQDFWKACLKAKDTKIKNIEMDGKKYYEITENNNGNGNDEKPQKTIKYVEKDTGITTKEIRITEEKTMTITTKYEFGVVTEADFLE